MSKQRKIDTVSDWPHLVSVGTQVGAVLAVLVLAALLQTGDGLSPQASANRELPPLPAPPGYADPTRTPEPAGVATPERGQDPGPAGADDPQADLQDPLAERATLDLERLGAQGSGWTAQVALLCDPASVERLLEQQGAGSSLYVLPSERADRLCFRMCWGHYASADAARSAADMPDALRAGDFFPVRVSAVIR